MIIDGVARLGHVVARSHVPVIGVLEGIIFQSPRRKWRVCGQRSRSWKRHQNVSY
jgi:hypothetical protein